MVVKIEGMGGYVLIDKGLAGRDCEAYAFVEVVSVGLDGVV
jgi:hypothetical protein